MDLFLNIFATFQVKINPNDLLFFHPNGIAIFFFCLNELRPLIIGLQLLTRVFQRFCANICQVKTYFITKPALQE